MTQIGRAWARDWSARIGQAVKRARLDRGFSQQELADTTERLGYPMSRNTVVNIEGGRSETVTVQQLAILAAALGVTPVELAYEIADGADVELVPGVSADAFSASEWFSGRGWLYGDEGEENALAIPAPLLAHWRFHADLMNELEGLQSTLAVEDGLTHSELRRRVREHERLIQVFRDGMRNSKMDPPQLPPEYAHLDRAPMSRLASPIPTNEIQWGSARGNESKEPPVDIGETTGEEFRVIPLTGSDIPAEASAREREEAARGQHQEETQGRR